MVEVTIKPARVDSPKLRAIAARNAAVVEAMKAKAEVKRKAAAEKAREVATRNRAAAKRERTRRAAREIAAEKLRAEKAAAREVAKKVAARVRKVALQVAWDKAKADAIAHGQPFESDEAQRAYMGGKRTLDARAAKVKPAESEKEPELVTDEGDDWDGGAPW